MSSFAPFAQAVHARLTDLSKNCSPLSQALASLSEEELKAKLAALE